MSDSISSSANGPIRPRYAFLDELRGFMVLCMVAYHGFCLGWYTFGIDPCGKLFEFFMPVEPLFASTFILLCGFCTVYSHSNLLRGAKLAVVAACVTAVTYVMSRLGYIERGDLITFGILHLLASCLLLFGLFEVVTRKKSSSRAPSPKFVYPMAVALLLFVLCYNIPYGSLGIGTLSVDIPSTLTDGNRLFFLGFVNSRYAAGDYFPLLPWGFIFLCGAFVARSCGGVLPEFFIKKRIPFFSVVGRHALLIYALHQPVWYLIFTVVSAVK